MLAHKYPISHPGLVLLIISVILTLLSVTATALRFAQRFRKGKLGWDDYSIITASGFTIGRTIIQLVSIPPGNGHHREDLTLKDYQYINFLGWVTQLFLFPILCLLKTSICLLALRIKGTKKLKICLWITIAGLVVTNGLPWIVLLAECNPVNAYWRSQAELCWTPEVRIYSIYVQTSYSVITDLMCSLLPVYIVWGLNMSKRKKLGVCGLMSLGLISTTFALLRASSLGTKTDDLSHAYCWASIWANIEVHLGIIAADLAIIWRMFYRRSQGSSGSDLRVRLGQQYDYPEQHFPYSPERRSLRTRLESGAWKAQHNVRVSGRRVSSAKSDGSKAPLGITKEVEYRIAQTRRGSRAGEVDAQEGDSLELRDMMKPKVRHHP